MRKILLAFIILAEAALICQGTLTDADNHTELFRIDQKQLDKVFDLVSQIASTFGLPPLEDSKDYNWTLIGEVKDLLLTFDQSSYCVREIKQFVFDVLYVTNKYPLLIKDGALSTDAILDALLNLYYTNRDCLPIANFVRFSVYELALLLLGTPIDLPPLKDFIISIDIPSDYILGKVALVGSDLYHTSQCLGIAIVGGGLAAVGALGWNYLDYKAKAELITSAIHAGRQTTGECSLAFAIFEKILQRSEKK